MSISDQEMLAACRCIRDEEIASDLRFAFFLYKKEMQATCVLNEQCLNPCAHSGHLSKPRYFRATTSGALHVGGSLVAQ